MTSCFHIIRHRYLATDRTHHRTTNCTLFITFGRVRQVVAPGAKSDIYDCLVSWIGGQVYHRAVGVRSSTCSKLCQCLANATVVCRSLPCIDGLSCTHRDQIYGQYSLHPRQGCKVSQSACLCVCLSVCLSVCSHISKATRKKGIKFSGLVARGLVSILLWRQCNTLCTFGFVVDSFFHIMGQNQSNDVMWLDGGISWRPRCAHGGEVC